MPVHQSSRWLLMLLLLYTSLVIRDLAHNIFYTQKAFLANNTRAEKCLVIILGQVRANELTWPSFHRHVLDPLNADLAVCVGISTSGNYTHNKDPFTANARYVWTFEEPFDAIGTGWALAFDQAAKEQNVKTAEWSRIAMNGASFLGDLWSKDVRTSACILLYARWFLLKSIRNEGVDKLYDRFIITRSDYYYPVPHPPLDLLNREYIWIPEGEDYGGITDRHIIVAREFLGASLGALDSILRYPYELHSIMSKAPRSKGPSWNLEKFLLMHFFNAGVLHMVRRFPACMYTVRANDTSTSRSSGKWNTNLGFNIKYVGEFERTNHTMKFFNSSWKQTASQYAQYMHPEKFSPCPNRIVFSTMHFPN